MELDRDHFSKELRRIATINDPNGIDGRAVQDRLRAEDPTAYRKMMEDLKLDGNEPEWDLFDLYDTLKKDKNPGQSEQAQLRSEYKRQQERKRAIVLKLGKLKKILRNGNDLDRERKNYLEHNIAMLKT